MKSKIKGFIVSLFFLGFSFSFTSAFAIPQAIIINDSNFKIDLSYVITHWDKDSKTTISSPIYNISIPAKSNDNIVSPKPQTTKNYVVIDGPPGEENLHITTAIATDKKGIVKAKGILGTLNNSGTYWSPCRAQFGSEGSGNYNTALILKDFGPLVLCDSTRQYYNDVNG